MCLIKKGSKYLKANRDKNFNQLPFENWIWTERKALAKKFTNETNARIELGNHAKLVKIIGGKHDQTGMENEKTPKENTD